MSDSFQDTPRRNNRDWPVISLADGVTPINRVYSDTYTAPADAVRRFPVAESATRATLTCATVSNPTVGTITLTDGRLIKIDGTTAGTYSEASSLELAVPVAGLSAAQIAAAIASAVVERWPDLLAASSGVEIGVFTSKGVNAIASNSLAWTTDTATLTLLRPGFPPECIVGTYHEKCDYLKLVACQMTGSTDTHATFSRRWQVDMQKLGETVPSLDIAALLKTGSLESVSREQTVMPPRQFLEWSETTTVVEEARTGDSPDSDERAVQSSVSPQNIAASKKQTTRASWSPPIPLVDQEYDSDTGQIRPVTRSTVPIGDAEGSPINSTGTITTVQQVDALWAVLDTRQATGLAGMAAFGVATRSRRFRDNRSLPRVLNYIEITPIYADPGDVFSDVVDYNWRPKWLANAYNGPCWITLLEKWTWKQPIEGGDDDWNMGTVWEAGVAYVAGLTPSFVTHNNETYICLIGHTAGVFSTDLATAKWRVSSPSLPTETPMFPQVIEFNGTDLNIQIGECLHSGQFIRDTQYSAIYQPTTPSRWPATIFDRVLLDPDQGGWMLRLFSFDSPPEGMGQSTGLDLSLKVRAGSSFTVEWTPGGGATKIDVSTDPSFTTGFLSGFENLTVASTAPYEKEVTGVRRGIPYFVRVRRTAASLTSNTLACVTEPQAELVVANGATEIATAGTLTFPTTVVGAEAVIVLTLRNDGILNLTDLAVDPIGGADAAMFEIATVPTGLGIGGDTQVNVTFAPTSTGAKVGVLTFTSDDPDSPHVINLTGTSTAPEINLKYGGTSYASGDSIETGTVEAGDYTFSYSVTIENTGTGDLVLGTSAIAGAGWSIQTAPASPVAGGGSTTCLVEFAPTVGGANVGTLTVPSNDASEPVYTLLLVAEVTALPEITVTSPWGGLIETGSTIHFGRVVSGARTLTFTIGNAGYDILNGLVVGGSGTGWSIGGISATDVAPGGTATVAVTFTTYTTDATFTGTLTIASNDADEPLFTVNLSIIQAAAATSQTQLEQPTGTLLTSGVNAVDFGNVLVTGGTLAKTFTYRNTGRTTSGTLATSVSGAHSAEFTVPATDAGPPGSTAGLTTPASSTTGTIASDDFTVTFNPAGYGPRTATLTVTDTADTPSVDFAVALTGVGLPSNALTTGQAASIFIDQPIPVVIAISPTGRLAVGDELTNRVYIWNTLPTGVGSLPPADITLVGNTSGVSGFSPAGLAWHGANLWVSDRTKNRILRYTNPQSATQNASLVLGQADFSITSANRGGSVAANTLHTPRRLIVRGSKLIVADSGNNRVLIFNTIPTSNGTAANVAVGQANLTNGGAGTTATTLLGPYGVAVSAAGKLVVADTGNHRVLQYSNIPTASGATAAIQHGQANLTTGTVNQGTGSVAANTLSGPKDVACHSSGALYIADSGNNRVVGFYEALASSGGNAHVVLGQVNFTSSGTSVMSGPSALYWIDTSLLVSATTQTLVFSPA